MPSPAPVIARRLGLVDYEEAWAEQRRLVAEAQAGGSGHLLLLEHPPTYTLGARGKDEHVLLTDDALTRLGAKVVRVDRGGDVTFHGPGQLVGYPVIDLRAWGQGPLWYVRNLEATLIAALAPFGLDGERRPGRPGVWLDGEKIASIGVHVSRGITSHGFALNVDPDLDYFSHIVPCGLPDVTVTSMRRALGEAPPLDRVIDAVVESFANVFEVEVQDGARTVVPAAWTPSAAL